MQTHQKIKKCPFCNQEIVNKQKIFETENFAIIDNINPLVEWHLMVIPKFHIRSEKEISEKLLKEYMLICQKAIEIIIKKTKIHPMSFVNAPQSQSVFHLHRHFFPSFFNPLEVDELLRKRIKAKNKLNNK